MQWRQRFFVELEDIFVEGLVHITKLHDDFYIFREKEHALVGINTKKRYRIGDKVIVMVDRVDTEKRQIDFLLVKTKGKKRSRAE
ncbi:MAG: S1 RNA-binding domain-containing protein [Nitrospirae bacterium]|nr:S1 RNA-binding domain-containing protein [Nitrospirota bacterium]